jgi:Lon protease-like protein
VKGRAARLDSPPMTESTHAPRPAPTAPVVPLFPLPGLFLFPGTALPLHIFEPRYKQMVEDLLDKSGRLVLGTVVPGHEHELLGSPPVHAIAGLGEIARHERYPDGRFLIFVVGLARVRLTEVSSDRAYRKVEVVPLPEQQARKEESPQLRKELMAALKARSPSIVLPRNVPLGQLTDLLLLHLRLDVTSMIDLYSRLDIADRARGALDRHATTPLPPKEAKKKPQAGDAEDGGGEKKKGDTE